MTHTAAAAGSRSEADGAGSSSDTVIEASDLYCRYGDFEAVAGVDVKVRRGKLFGLLGTNGAGKTTTVETLEGHRRAQAGTVRVLGMDPYRQRRRLAGDVGMILQDSGSTGDLTVAETLRLWQRLHPRHAGPADPLSEVDLGHRRDVRVGQLSGGERRRLDLALAISTGPRVLFLDEPTTGLDPASRERTWSVLRDLLRGGCGILLTTHYLEEAEELADELAIMDRGRVAVAGTPQQVVAGHASRIRCGLSREWSIEDLPPFEGTTSLHGGELTIRTPQLQDDLRRLLDWAHRRECSLSRLSATEASLREVFAEIQSSAEAVRSAAHA